jgi:hypothetical protein
MSKALFISIFLVTNVCFADKIKDHIKPLPEELLKNPVTLKCGVTIIENIEKRNGDIVSSELTDKDITVLNAVCSKVSSNYNSFISSHRMGLPKSEIFFWEASLLPDTNNYRCLNDTRYRFYSRRIQEGNVPVDGYTDAIHWHTFSLSNRNSKFFKTVFAHEIFHAMNIFNGIDDTESLAEEFTFQLGYGK